MDWLFGGNGRLACMGGPFTFRVQPRRAVASYVTAYCVFYPVLTMKTRYCRARHTLKFKVLNILAA